MRKDEFLKMMIEDIQTESEPKKSLYMDVIDCMDIALSQCSADFDVPHDKTVKGAFELIERRGKERQKQGVACVGPFEAAEIIAEYLGAKYERVSKRYITPKKTVKLEDFI